MPVTNILSGETQTPTPGLQHAADQLETAGNTAGATPATGGPRAGFLTTTSTIQASVFSYMDSQFGSAKGPVVNAKAEFSNYFTKAVGFGYDFNNTNVINAFANFLLAVATQGFSGSDTTGTQMGNYQGSWPGGGFK